MSAPCTVHDFDFDGHQMVAYGYNESMGGIPVIFFHGITSSVKFWTDDPLPIFRDSFRCYSVSLPGHYPASFRPGMCDDDLTAQLIADLEYRTIRALVGDQPVLLVGHSTGGFSIYNLAARYPELACGLLSICGFFDGHWTGILGFAQQQARWAPWFFLSTYRLLQLQPILMRFALRYYAGDVPGLYQSAALQKSVSSLYDAFLHLDLQAMLIWFRRMPKIDISPMATSIQAPTHILCGEKDPIIPRAQQSRAVQLIKGAQIVEIAGAGHSLMFEKEQEYNAIVTRWAESWIGRS